MKKRTNSREQQGARKLDHPLSGIKLKRKTDLNSEGKTRKTTPVKRTH